MFVNSIYDISIYQSIFKSISNIEFIYSFKYKVPNIDIKIIIIVIIIYTY